MKNLDATIAITYKCNARCKFCWIWKIKPKKEINAKIFKKLPPLRNVNITGGEPFLREDLPDIVKLFKKTRVIISSNGLLPEMIADCMERILRINPKTGIGISIDGIGEMHDRMRGINGAFRKAIYTIKLLKEFVNDIRIDFTASNENINHLLKVYKLAKDLGVQFTSTVVHSSPIYFHKVNPLPSREICTIYKKIAKLELKSIHPKNWFRAYFYHNLTKFIKRERFRKDCGAGRDFFFLDPYGNVFPCPIINQKIGNLKRQKWKEIWNSKRADMLRAKLVACDRCWMMCSAAPYIRKHIFDALRWIIPNKLKSLV